MTTNDDLAKAWYDGQVAGEVFQERLIAWQLEERGHRGSIPQRPACPYAVTVDTSITNLQDNCAAAAQMFEQHRRR